MSRRCAFTLLELLIVIAIISILAVIALPNLLEAQTRAKLARARADLRTVVTGIEMYRVDHNAYPTYHYAGGPIEFHIGGAVPAWPSPDPAWDGANPITTPVAYLTIMPQDPFRSFHFGPPEQSEYLYVNWDYALTRSIPGGLVEPFTQARDEYGSYRLHSRGPDGKGPNTGTPYDATNGTVSEGDLTYGPRCGYDHLYVP